MRDTPIYVTRPSLPPLGEFITYLETIWEEKWITNNGSFHQLFEKELAQYLGVEYISVFSNGTLALITALRALNITGEVITTPFSFVATTHSLWWNGITPVFADIEPGYMNIDPKKIEEAITSKTTAIMGVHVYGNPCDVEAIQKEADKHNLKVIYDAAHAFGVKKNGESILNFGDLSVLSFHATKTFNTIEGGAIVCHSAEMKHHIDNLKNFGFRNEITVEEPGINAKMNEVQAAYGVLQLKYVDGYIAERKRVTESYRTKLEGTAGIKFLYDMDEVTHAYSYFPICVDPEVYGMQRDEIYELMKLDGVKTRRYFYPLISHFNPYCDLPSAAKELLPVAEKVSEQILCLPIYPELTEDEITYITNLIITNAKGSK